MIKILLHILLVGLLSCSRTEKKQSVISTDSSETEEADSVLAAKTIMDDYQASFVYSDSDSDSLLLDNQGLKNLISLFKTKGRKIQDKVYEGGDCGGKFIRLIHNGDTLTIDKYNCGDYGFGNSQYLKHGDSLKLVRKYKMEWSAQLDKKIEFNVTEDIFEFSEGKVTISERTKVINEWKNFDFNNISFVTTISPGEMEYINLKKEQREILNRDVLEK